jgi:hypothetical protein
MRVANMPPPSCPSPCRGGRDFSLFAGAFVPRGEIAITPWHTYGGLRHAAV